MDSQEVERTGVYECGKSFTQNGFIFREQSIADYGIDAIIEAKEEGNATGKMIAVQIKSGESYFKEIEEDYVVFRVDEKHRNYWINHSLPVIVILYSPSRNECIWEIANKYTLISCNKSWKIKIPKSQTIENARFKLLEISKNISDYEHRHSSLVLAKKWMLETLKQGQLILEVTEWINKSSGRGNFVLKSFDDGQEIILFERELWGFGLKSYDLVIQQMFPWAHIEIDKAYYEENMEMEDNINWDIFDSDDDIIEVLPREVADGIYPYKNVAGEVDCYRLILTLNDVGKAFLTTEEFLEKGKFYCIDHLMEVL